LLLALANTVIFGSESHGNHDHILLSDGSGSLQTRLKSAWDQGYAITCSEGWYVVRHIKESDKKGEAIHITGVKARRVVRRRDSHTQMAVSLSALGAGSHLPPRNIPGTHFC
jgi:hypothetical protein